MSQPIYPYQKYFELKKTFFLLIKLPKFWFIQMLIGERRYRVDSRTGLHSFRLALFASALLVGFVNLALNRPTPLRNFLSFQISFAAHGRSSQSCTENARLPGLFRPGTKSVAPD